MAALSNQRTTPLLIIAVALLLGYMGYSGTGLEMLGIPGITQAKDTIVARKKTIDSLLAMTDSAKKILAAGQRGRSAPPSRRVPLEPRAACAGWFRIATKLPT